jgi:Transglutaminase-like superfamily
LKAALETWRRFQNLSACSRTLVLEAAVALLLTRAGLRLVGFRLWKSALDWSLGGHKRRACVPGLAALDAARAVARLEQAAARHILVDTNCLERSLVLWWLLERRGICARLRLGARTDQGHFEAHAWVEACGVVLEDLPSVRFRPFDQPTAWWETGNS